MVERHAPLSLRDLLPRLDWRQELLGVAVVVAEAFPVYLLASVFLNPTGMLDAFPFAVVLFLLLTAHAVSRVLDELRIWSPEYEIKMLAGVAVTLLVAVRFGSYPDTGVFDPGWLRDAVQSLAFLPNQAERPVWGIVVLTAYAWWRGRSRSEAGIDSAFGMLRFGSLALVFAIIIVLLGAPEGAAIRDRLSGAAVGFYASSLAAIGISRLKLEGVRSSAPLGPRWLGTFVAPILVVVIVAILAAGIFSRQLFDTVVWMLTPVFWVLGLVFQAIVLVVAVLAYLILTPIFWLIGERDIQLIPATPVVEDPEGQPGFEDAVGEAFQLPDPLRYLIAALVLFILFSLITRYVFKRRSQSRPPTDEERESVLDWDDLLANAGNRLRGLFRREPDPDPLAHLRGDETWRDTLRIREVYVRLQEKGETLGAGRRRGETATEYGPRVSRQFDAQSGAPAAVDAITSRYRRARYSGRPATTEDADIVDANWTTIESIPDPEKP